jgi:Zn-dependent peptidase ImmA (M78 family)
MSKIGRPKIPIDWNQFDKLCAMHCTLEEIASFFNVSEDTIERRCVTEKKKGFADLWRQKAAKGKISLRRKTWQKIDEGNTAVLIFALKNILGWSDKITTDTQSQDSTIPVVTFAARRADKKADK